MPEVTFRIVSASPVPFAATPQLRLVTEVETTGQAVRSMLVRASVRLNAELRDYGHGERERLEELFGTGSVWARAPKSLLWANVSAIVPGFENRTTFDVEVPCTQDLAVAASKYLSALEEGEIPITVQFSGMLFYAGSSGLEVSQIPWDREDSFRFPVALFQNVVNEHFPNAVVFGMRKDVFERLESYRRAQGLLKVDDAVECLLNSAQPRKAN